MQITLRFRFLEHHASTTLAEARMDQSRLELSSRRISAAFLVVIVTLSAVSALSKCGDGSQPISVAVTACATMVDGATRSRSRPPSPMTRTQAVLHGP